MASGLARQGCWSRSRTGRVCVVWQEAACPHSTGMYLPGPQPYQLTLCSPSPGGRARRGCCWTSWAPVLMNLPFTGVSLKLPTKPFPRPRLVGTRQHAHGGPHHAAGGPSRRNLAHEGVSRPWEAWAHLLGELQTPPTPARSLARLWLRSQPHFAGTAPPAQAQDSAGRTTPARQVWGRGRGPPQGPGSSQREEQRPRTAGRTACRGAGGRAGPGRAADGEFYGRAQSGGRR